MKRILLIALLALLPVESWAACSFATIPAKDGSGTTQNMLYCPDASSNKAMIFTLGDGTNPDNVATVTSNRLLVDPSGVTSPVSIAGTVTISGTVTANAGTNLNTSALALESGGNLATLAGAVTSSKFQDNVAQFGGSAVVTGTGTGGAGIPRVTISNDSSLAANQSVNVNQIGGSAVATGASGVQIVGLGCAGVPVSSTTTAPINNGGSSSNLKLVSKQTGQNVYICAINIGPVASAVNVALVAGTKTTNECDTSTAGLAGGTTAATGWQLAANGGLTYGNGAGVVAKTASTGLDVCLLFSGGVQVSGVITYAQF